MIIVYPYQTYTGIGMNKIYFELQAYILHKSVVYIAHNNNNNAYLHLKGYENLSQKRAISKTGFSRVFRRA